MTDDEGRVVTLEAPAQRIISLAPHITELLFEIGVGDQIVGVSAYSDYPIEARSIPRIGDAARMDRERIVALQPDLVFVWGSGNPRSEIEVLRALHIPLFVTEPRALEDIPRYMETFGVLTGARATANRAASSFRTRLSALAAEYGQKSLVRTFYQISQRPLYTVNDQHLISEILRFCGGTNVFGSLSSLAASVSLEAVVKAAPDAILFGEYPGAQARQVTTMWSQWPLIPAVSSQHIFGVSAEIMHRSGPRILQAVEKVCAALETVRADQVSLAGVVQ